jgi:hypothetical protein
MRKDVASADEWRGERRGGMGGFTMRGPPKFLLRIVKSHPGYVRDPGIISVIESCARLRFPFNPERPPEPHKSLPGREHLHCLSRIGLSDEPPIFADQSPAPPR